MENMISLKKVIEICGLSRASIYKEMREGDFPKNFKITARTTRWVESEIRDWLNKKVENRYQPES